MSLRRSSRISTSTSKNTSQPNGFTQKDAKNNPPKSPIATTTKKRKAKSTAPTTSSSASCDAPPPTKDDAPFLTGIIDGLQKSDFAAPSLPATPLPKRRKVLRSESPAKALPFTPTPAGVGLMTTEYGHPLEDLPNMKPRPAEPHVTNAPLSTPGGSRVVAFSSSPAKPASGAASASQEVVESPAKKKKASVVAPPDVGVLHPPTSTVDSLLEDACEHLCKVDPKLKELIERHHCKMFSPEGLREVVDPFTALASGIMGQQVSGQAAASIRKKFTALFPETHPAFPSPAQVTEQDIPTLRTAGLSQRKAEYIHGLAQKFNSGELSAQMLISASDEELIDKLVAVRGLGRWSVEMFACSGLKRMDVFSTGDLGVQRGMAVYVGRDVSKLKSKGGKWKYMTEKEMLETAAKFSPYRSLFMWYMWRIEDVDISVLTSN